MNKEVGISRRNKSLLLASLFLILAIAAYFIYDLSNGLHNLYEYYSFKKVVGLPAQMVSYSSQAGSFSIEHPTGWAAGDTPRGNHGDQEVVAVISTFALSPYIVVSEKDLSSTDSITLTDWGQQRVEAKRDHRFLTKLKPYASVHYPGYSAEYSYTGYSVIIGKFTYHCVDWYTQNNNKGYAFSFCSSKGNWDEVKPIFLQMIDSIVFTDGQ